MKPREEIAERWNATIDKWMRDLVPYRPHGDDPATGLSCLRGVVRLLYRAAGIELPDYLEGGDDVLEQYRGLFHCVRLGEARLGDVASLVGKGGTHAGVMLDARWVAHMDPVARMCRTRLARLYEGSEALTILRYHGPGAEVFA